MCTGSFGSTSTSTSHWSYSVKDTLHTASQPSEIPALPCTLASSPRSSPRTLKASSLIAVRWEPVSQTASIIHCMPVDGFASRHGTNITSHWSCNGSSNMLVFLSCVNTFCLLYHSTVGRHAKSHKVCHIVIAFVLLAISFAKIRLFPEPAKHNPGILHNVACF